MRTITVKDKTIKLYDSIDEMPIINFQKYNKCILIDVGLGSDIDSIDAHIVNVAKYINKGDKVNAIQELQNMRQNMHMIVSKVSPKYMAFAALIHSINGVEQKDLSDSHLQEIIDELQEVPHGFITDLLSVLKKKLSAELETYFPSEFESAKEKEVYNKLKERTIFQLQEISENVDNSQKIAELNDFLFSLHKPKIFTGKDSVEIKYDKQFESACMLISQKTNMDAKKMTTLQFYNTIDNIYKQVEAERKALRGNKPKRT